MKPKTSSQGECYYLLPSPSLAEFPTNVDHENANDLLLTWTACWHPALLAAQNHASLPLRAGVENPESPASIIYVPKIAEKYVTDSLLLEAKKNDWLLIRTGQEHFASRQKLTERGLSHWPSAALAAQGMDTNLIEDFFALAYAYLQVQIMTRQLRSSSNLNQQLFDDNLIRAANAAVIGDREQSTEHLTACFDLLMEERNCYYPTRPQLIDLILLAETTIEGSLNQQLESSHVLTLLMTGQIAKQLAKANPAAVEKIRQLLDDRRLGLIGGLNIELPDSLVSSESALRQLVVGRQIISEQFQVEPRIYCRRRFGLNPSLPATLEQFEFLGAVHVTFDGGRLPNSSNVNIRWTGIDGSSIQAHCEPAVDAGDASVLLRLGRMFGQQIDSTHTAVALFTHWPNRTCESFQDLINIQKYAPVLGHFVHAEEYFESLYDPGYGDQLELNDYRTPYLRQAVANSQINPISRYVDYWRAHYLLLSCRALFVQTSLKRRWNSDQDSSSLKEQASPAIPDQASTKILADIFAVEMQLDSVIDDNDFARIKEVLDACFNLPIKFWEVHSGLPNSSSDGKATSVGDRNEPFTYDGHWSVINTVNFRRRTILKLSSCEMIPRESGSVIFADHNSQESTLVLDLVGNSELTPLFAPKSADLLSDRRTSEPSIVDGLSLKNEFFELQVDLATGGIKTLTTYLDRQNLVGQQLAARIPESPEPNSGANAATSARYTRMVADDIRTKSQTRISAAIVSQGRLLDGDHVVATFQQTVTVTRGIPIAELKIELDPQGVWPNLLNYYLCNRLAWKDEASQLSASFQEFHQPFNTEWTHATNFVQIEQGNQKVTLLTGGLPHHRRASRKMLDSLLIVGKETCREFRLGIGVNLPFPMLSSVSRLTPAIICPVDSRISSKQDNWFFHFDRKNILVTCWEPLFDAEDRIVEVQIRCRETEGRAGELTISCQQAIKSASLVSLAGRFLRSLKFDPAASHQASHHFQAFESFQISIRL